MNAYRKFLVVWAGQCLSLLGSSILSFALGVWVYQQTGSVRSFGLVIFCAALPHVLLAPISGVLVDRLPRQKVMLACNLGAAVSAALLLLFLAQGLLAPGQVYWLTLLGTTCMAVHQLAYAASVSTLLPERALRAKAAGMMQLGVASAFVIGPLVAGVLLAWIGLRGVIVLDGLSFLLAAAALCLVRLRELAPEERRARRPFFTEFGEGLQHVRTHAGLAALMALVAASNFSIGFVQVLFTPMVLQIATQETLGLLISIGGAGMVLGGIACSVRGVPARAMRGVWLGLACGGACMAIGALRASVPLWGASVFCYFLSIPLVNASLQSLWQQRIPAALQGRVFAVRNMLSYTCLPLAYVLSPWLATHWFEPWMARDGALASSLGAWLGTGAGRGMGLMFLIVGLVLLVLAVFAALSRSLNQEPAAPVADLVVQGQGA